MKRLLVHTVEQLVHQVRFDADVPGEQLTDEQVGQVVLLVQHPLHLEPLDEEHLSASESGVVSCMEKTETRAVVQAAIAELPAQYRVLIVLREIEGRSGEEIAQIVGRSPDSVRTGLYRARQILKKRIRPYLEEVES